MERNWIEWNLRNTDATTVAQLCLGILARTEPSRLSILSFRGLCRYISQRVVVKTDEQTM
jgi:hypothetical protein